LPVAGLTTSKVLAPSTSLPSISSLYIGSPQIRRMMKG
jgi:hypothetical protein